VEGTDAKRRKQPRNKEMNQPAVSSRSLVSGARGFEASGSCVGKSWDTSTGCQSGRKGQEALSTNIWPPLESRVWRPGEVSADDHLKSRRGHVALDGRWDMDPSRGIQLDLPQSEADFFDKLSCPYCGDAQKKNYIVKCTATDISIKLSKPCEI
jgi:hypothetical protein